MTDVSKLPSTDLHRACTLITNFCLHSDIRRNILSEQFDDVDDSDTDSTATCDVEEVMAVATIIEALPVTECLEYIWWPSWAAIDLCRVLTIRKRWKKEWKCSSVYLDLPAYLSLQSSLLSNSCTCKFHPCYCYCQIPLLPLPLYGMQTQHTTSARLTNQSLMSRNCTALLIQCYVIMHRLSRSMYGNAHRARLPRASVL